MADIHIKIATVPAAIVRLGIDKVTLYKNCISPSFVPILLYKGETWTYLGPYREENMEIGEQVPEEAALISYRES